MTFNTRRVAQQGGAPAPPPTLNPRPAEPGAGAAEHAKPAAPAAALARVTPIPTDATGTLYRKGRRQDSGLLPWSEAPAEAGTAAEYTEGEGASGAHGGGGDGRGGAGAEAAALAARGRLTVGPEGLVSSSEPAPAEGAGERSAVAAGGGPASHRVELAGAPVRDVAGGFAKL